LWTGRKVAYKENASNGHIARAVELREAGIGGRKQGRKNKINTYTALGR